MGQQFSEISDQLTRFIEEQKIFFTGTAGAEGLVNVSPKGMDAFRVLNPNRVAWLNVTGSGNETAAHVLENGRMTIMFCAFDGRPLILRLYGTARAVHPRDPDWEELYGLFGDFTAARQVFDVTVDMVQTSCGMGVPYFDYQEDRDQLIKWANKKGRDGVRDYWEEKNQLSLDGKPTGVFD